MFHSRIRGAKKQRTNDLPRVSQLRFKSLPNTYLKQTNTHNEINQNITTLSLVFSYCYLSCGFYLLLTNSRKRRWNCFRFIFEKERFNSAEIPILNDPGYNNAFNLRVFMQNHVSPGNYFVKLLHFPSSRCFHEHKTARRENTKQDASRELGIMHVSVRRHSPVSWN